MLTAYSLTGTEPLIQGICRAAFPNYSGRMFKLRVQETVDVRSYWDGGSRDYFAFVDLATLRASGELPSMHPAFDPHYRGSDAVAIPDGFACVRHSIFCGKDTGLTIIVNSRTMNPSLLPPSVELSRDQRIVLAATVGLKASYGGVKDFRFSEASQETGITRDRWDTAKAECIARKLLNGGRRDHSGRTERDREYPIVARFARSGLPPLVRSAGRHGLAFRRLRIGLKTP